MSQKSTKKQDEYLSNLMVIKGLVADSLLRNIKKDDLRKTQTSYKYGQRIFGYEDCLRDAGMRAFRGFNGETYWFSGKYWEPLKDGLLEVVLRDVMVGVGAEKEDIVRGMSRLMKAVKLGAELNPLKTSRYIVGFSNGVVDFRNIDEPVFHEFEDMMPVTSVLPYPYDKDALCPRWEAFLKSVLTMEQREILQMFLGLGCVPRNNMERKIEKTLWLVGSGDNGKSVIFEVMNYVFGKDNISSVALHNLIKSGDEGARFVAAVSGKIFNYCSEVDDGDIGKYEGNFKSIVSGERQQARKIGGNVEMVSDIPYLVFNMNVKPSNRTMGQAFMKRLEIIEFHTTVSKRDMKTDLASELCAEAPGIRNWLVQGYRMLRDRGFKFPDTDDDKKTKRGYMLENNRGVLLFLSDKGYGNNRDSGHWDEKGDKIAASELYNEYLRWCQENTDVLPETQNNFGREMTRLGYKKNRTHTNNFYTIFKKDKTDNQQQ